MQAFSWLAPSLRRPIRYLERLKASRQYKEARDELRVSMPAS